MTEVDQKPIAEVLRNVAREAVNDVRRGVLVGADDGAQLFRIEAFGQCRRAHQVAEHHRQLAALALGGRGRGRGGRDRRGTNHFGGGNPRRRLGAIQLGDGLEEFLAVPQRLDAELP